MLFLDYLTIVVTLRGANITSHHFIQQIMFSLVTARSLSEQKKDG